MNYYRIDYKRLVWLLLPINMRRVDILAFLRAFVAPIENLYKRFLAYRSDTNYKIHHNSQVCYLQAVLNDAFDMTDRRIYISDAEITEWANFLWDESEDRPVMLYDDSYFMLYDENFIGANAIDFVVYVPQELNLSESETDRMNALIKYYKLASKRYIITIV